MTTHTAEILWRAEGDFAGNGYSRAHLWRFDGGVEVPASASPAVVPPPASREDAVDPEEAFVASLSSCHMLWFLDLARRDGWNAAAYRDRAEGRMARAAGGASWIDRVELRPEITWDGPAPDRAALKALHGRAHAACFIANSVRTEVVTVLD